MHYWMCLCGCVCLCAIETTFPLSNFKTKHIFGTLVSQVYSLLKPLDLERKSDKLHKLCANVSKTKLKNSKRQTGDKGRVHQLLSESKNNKKNQPSNIAQNRNSKKTNHGTHNQTKIHINTQLENKASDLYMY